MKGKLQLTFCEIGNIFMVGMYDGYSFGDSVLPFVVYALMRDNDKKFIYDYSVTNWDWFHVKKPNGFSAIKWFIASRKTRCQLILDRELSKDKVRLLNPIDDRWHVVLNLGKNPEKINKYFHGYGEGQPFADILFASKADILNRREFFEKADIGFFDINMNKNLYTSLSSLSSENFVRLNKILDNFDPVIIGIGGGIFFLTRHINKEDMRKKLNSIADEHNLEIEEQEVLPIFVPSL